MKKRTRQHRSFWIVLVSLVCVMGSFFVGDLVRVVERMAYPRNYAPDVRQYAAQYGIEENIIYAVIRTESGFRPDAESDAGARGLMQITDETFEWIKSKLAPDEEITFDDLFDPQVNIRFGAYLLSACLARYDGDLSTSAAAYHSGMGLVDSLLEQAVYSSDGKTLSSFPYRQMNRYVYKINESYQKYCAIYTQ